jgi:hypothetical protein
VAVVVGNDLGNNGGSQWRTIAGDNMGDSVGNYLGYNDGWVDGG